MLKRPPLVVAGTVLGVGLLAGIAPATEAAPGIRHFQEIQSLGTVDFDSTLAVGAAGDLVVHAGYVGGTLAGQTSAGGRDAFVAGLSYDLHPLWEKQIGGPGEDAARAVATDGTRVVVGGISEGGIGGPALGGTDGWLMVLESNGHVVRTSALGGANSDGVSDVALADDGYYAAGWIGGQAVVWKFAHDGALDWSVEVPGNKAAQIVVQSDQVVVSTVVFWEEGDEGTALVSLDPADGSQNWAGTPSFGGATGLATDGTNIFVTRWSIDFDDYRYIGLITAVDPNGTRLWGARIYEGEGFDYDAIDVAWDGSAVVVVSNSQLVAFSPTGAHTWYQGLPGLDPTSVAMGWDGLYVGGETNDAFDGTRHDGAVAWAPTFQPDARARYFHNPALLGDDRYGKRGQRLLVTVEGTKPRNVIFNPQNDGEVAQNMTVTGCGSHDGYSIRYYDFDGPFVEVTEKVTGAGFRTGLLYPEDGRNLRVIIKPLRRTTGSTTCKVRLISAKGDRDTITLVIKRP
ncbi:hypothetical protein F0U44_21330 [Nocardioides humilatus]|uniref:Uncharacterized protein n=1 Tax=Nocardioides humilatus TaxID=2607660 RepID=A0A5B1L4E9_9ACTN|nr:hypothetical protein [Nocardioides humilatus]KAA1415522.1 hypothetical protein F0U44_21330 [Nocardioides humilatus]